MSADPYSAEVRQCFAEPAHMGQIDGVDAILVADQGVRVELSMRTEGESIAELRFRAWGCPHLIAAVETFCAQNEEQPVVSLLEFSVAGLMKSLSVPVEKTGRILVLEDAIRSLGARSGV